MSNTRTFRQRDSSGQLSVFHFRYEQAMIFKCKSFETQPVHHEIKTTIKEFFAWKSGMCNWSILRYNLTEFSE